MKKFLGLFLLTLLLGACAGTAQMDREKELYGKYDQHCREHAMAVSAEMDEEKRYQECMDYFVGTDPECPYCRADY